MCSSPPWAVCPARRPLAASTCAARVLAKDGFGSDMDKIESECHLLPHFNPDTNTNADLIGYESGYLLDLKHRAIVSISLFCQQFYSRSKSLYKWGVKD